MSTNGQIDQLLEGLDEADFDDFNELNPPDGVGFEDDIEAARRSTASQLQDEIPYDSFFAAPASSETMPAVGFMTARARPLAPPSAAALARARQLFLDDDDDSVDAVQEAASATTIQASSSQVFQAPSAKRPRLDGGANGSGHSRVVGHTPSRAPPGTAVSLSQTRSRPSTSAASARSFVADLFAQADANCDQIEVPSSRSTESPCRGSYGTATDPFPSTGEATGEDMQRRPTASWGFVTGGGRNVAPISQDARRAAMALFGESSGSNSAVAPSTPVRPATTNMVSSRGGLQAQAPTFATPRIAQLSGFATPSRTPLANKTNTLPQGASPSATAIKLPKAIEIKTPLSAKRRIGLGGSTPGITRRAKGFVTPFRKDGDGVVTSPIGTRPMTIRSAGKPPNDDAVAKHFAPVFDLTIPPGRTGWRDAYLYPGFYASGYLAEMGVPEEIWQLGIDNASRYQFVDDNSVVFGVKAAYIILKRDGCHLATERWVENHWSLILWKLAGMVHAKPDLYRPLWRWEEVLKQLKYRYEREFGAVQRPIIRKIQEHDASAATPMILCVSGITFPPPSKDEEGKTVQHRPYMDLTDGWYRILAEVDDCLARAIRRGRITVGRKLGVAAAKLESSGDGAEVLDAYEKSRLVISGNSTHLARWDAKLGAQHQPFIASLASLSVDGGLISVVDVRVEKVFPLAFMNANRATRDPPWDEKEELERQGKWNEKCAAETARLQDTMQKRLEAVEDLAGTLWSQAEDLRGPFGEPPDTIDADFEDLLEAHDAAAQIRRLSPSRVYHLAVYARVRVEKEMAETRDEIEAELKAVCPPRDVRDFRMVRLVDAWSGTKESTRTAMLNVWDARQLGDEVQEGRRYLISSLVPAKNGQWALPKPGSGIKPEVYLHTRRDTRWSAVDE